jgi:hypothetical protein
MSTVSDRLKQCLDPRVQWHAGSAVNRGEDDLSRMCADLQALSVKPAHVAGCRQRY